MDHSGIPSHKSYLLSTNRSSTQRGTGRVPYFSINFDAIGFEATNYNAPQAIKPVCEYAMSKQSSSRKSAKAGLTLRLRGFNTAKNIINDVNGAVELLTDSGHCAAAWSFLHGKGAQPVSYGGKATPRALRKIRPGGVLEN